MLNNVQTFGIDSDKYAKFRPKYPKDFYDFLLQHVPTKDKMWDCACGNGQVAIDMVDHFNQIYATDINRNQLDNAFKHPKINYSLQKAEKTDFPNHFFDLICVAQALHWFDMEAFFNETDRVLKKGGILAVFAYGFFHTNSETDTLLEKNLYLKIKDYWSDRNQLVINKFAGISFPFNEIKSPLFEIHLAWNLSDMISYIKTWSAVKLYNSQNKVKLEHQLYQALKNDWKGTIQVKMDFFSFVRKK